MKKNKIILLVLIASMMIGIVGYAVAHPTSILEFGGTSHTGCHGSSGVASSGSLQVSTSTSGKLITLTATIQGFTDALPDNNNRSGTVSIGIPYNLGDNKEFALGMDQNTVNGETDYWGVGIWEIELDSSGNTVNPLKFRVLAPEADGTYDLIVAVVNAANTTGDEQPILYLHDQLVITVTSGSVSIASLAFVIPYNSVLVYATCGIFASGTIFLLIKRRRK